MADDAEVNIRITGDASDAKDDISAVGRGLKSITSLASNCTRVFSRFMRVLGTVSLVITGINLAISAVQKLRNWIHRAEAAAKAMREELAKVRYANEVAAAAEAYKKLNAEIERANKLEQDRNNILKNRRAVERDNEDARRELSKQGEIAALDPAADDYRERRMAIERKYERMASDTAESRAREDSAAQAAELRGQAAGKERAIAGQEKALDRQRRITATAAEAWRRSGSEEDLKEFQGQVGKEDLIRDAIKKLNDEADSLRRQAAELVGGNLAAKMRNAANQQRITNEEREEDAAAKKKAEAETKAKAESEAREKARKEAQDAQEERRKKVDSLSSRASELERFADRAAATQGVSTNRLTALGLGSGVSARTNSVANDVKKLVGLMKDQIEATKANKPSDVDGIAVFAE